MSFLSIFAAILGTAEKIVPVFIHNPKSQQVEAVIATSADHAVAALSAPASNTSSPVVKVASAILGAAETIVPIFIHNPQTQAVEGVIATTAEGVVQGLAPATQAAAAGT